MNNPQKPANPPSNLLPWQQEAVICHSQRLLASFQHWTGRKLIHPEATPEIMTPEIIARALFEAPFVIASHGTEPDPVLNYGNRMALTLWEMDWPTFTQTPSRQTAEPIERVDRARLLQEAREKGFIDNYQGIRISSSGRRFKIQNVVLWDVLDESGCRIGQAATFDHWDFI